MSRMNGDREKYFDTFFLSYNNDKSKIEWYKLSNNSFADASIELPNLICTLGFAH